MPYLADTNVLLRMVLRSDPQHRTVRDAVRRLVQQGEQLCFVPQNMAEFWNVCTRPVTARGGLGLGVAQADWAARIIERVFTLLPDSPAVYFEWRRLVVSGKSRACRFTMRAWLRPCRCTASSTSSR